MVGPGSYGPDHSGADLIAMKSKIKLNLS
jgi:hypothetical protein